ncbi:MAG TPA: type III-A CRISPR-associated RAMP protein Csm5, partial [Acidobacteriota bacterium]|nr:type III-A CRISPR-associated RAMP protein Csm5 [Acidobacteriota bacterium]
KARGMVRDLRIKHPEIVEWKAGAMPGFTAAIDGNAQAEVAAIFRNALDGGPYIPGSTIKGALRTALLERMRAGQKREPGSSREKHTDFEAKIIKDRDDARFSVGDDPFKFLKVSDFRIDNPSVMFGTARVIGKEKTQKGIPIYTEMSASELTIRKRCIAQGSVVIDEKGLAAHCTRLGIRPFISGEDLLESMDKFYGGLLENDKHPVPKEIKDLISKGRKSEQDKTTPPIRIGRFTQIETKTFKVPREDKRPADINMRGGVSRTLVGNYQAGWGLFRMTEDRGKA